MAIIHITRTFRSILLESFRTSAIVIKITVPVSLITRILTQLGVTDYLGLALAPLMEIVGLPGSMGLVLATSIITHLYAAMIVFFSFAPTENLTVAQVTILATMLLLAHALPVEVQITRKAGPRFRVMLLLRLIGAFLLGWILYQAYRLGGFLQTPATIIWEGELAELSWVEWLIEQAKTVAMIFVMITLLISLMKVLNRLRITVALAWILNPLLRLLGMSANAAPVTIIGTIMGLGYGGGLIINEAKSGRMSKRDILFSLGFMSLMHSAIEDTLLMIVMGGHVSGVIWGRLAFAVLVIFILVRISNRMSDKTFTRVFFHKAP